MFIYDSIDEQSLWVSPSIRKFKNISNLDDYLKIASRDRLRDVNKYTDGRRRPKMIGRIFSWSRSDKISLAILLIGAAAFIVTTMALLLAAGLLVL